MNVRLRFVAIALLSSLSAPGLAVDPSLDPKGSASASADATFEHDRFEEALNLIHSFGAPNREQRISELLGQIHARNPNSAYLFAARAEMAYMDYRSDGDTTLEEVIALAQRAIQLGPNIADSYIPMAMVLTDQQRYGEAKQAVDTALRLAPSKPEAMFAAAHWAEAVGDFDMAETYYLKDIDALPSPTRKANIYYWLSEMYMKKKPADFDRAFAARKMTVELAPVDPYKLCHYSDFLNRYTDRYDEAIDYATRSLKIRDVCTARHNLAIGLYARWAEGYLNPAKRKAMKTPAKPPELIREETHVSFEEVFVEAPEYKTARQVPMAMVKAGLIRNVDVVPPGYCCNALHGAASANNLEMAKFLVGKGANVNAQERDTRDTAVWRFVESRNVEAVQFFISKGARVNAVNARGVPLVHKALRFDDRDQALMVKALLDAGADPSLPNEYGANLLVEAAERLNAPVVEVLLNRYHMDPNSKDAEGKTALAYALSTMSRPRKQCIAMLLAAGATPWVMMGGTDAMEMVETYQVYMKARYPDRDEVAAMLREARARTPKPAGFDEWQPPAKTTNR